MENRSQDWRTIRASRPVNEERVATYRRVMDAEARLDEVRKRRGLPETAISDALDAIEGDGDTIEAVEDLCLRTLARYVAQLGGQVELRAVFPDETVVLLEAGESWDS